MDDDLEGVFPLNSSAREGRRASNTESDDELEIRVFELVSDLVADADEHFNNGNVVDEQVTINNMNWLSEILEQAEAYFRQSSSSKRDNQLIGHLIRTLDDFEDFFSMLERKLQAESAERANNTSMNSAVCRILLALSPMKARFIIEMLYVEDVLDRVIGWTNHEQATTINEMQLQCYASGLLSIALRDRSIADAVVNHESYPINILRRAKYYAESLESESAAASEYMLDVQKRNMSSKYKKSTPSQGKKRKLSSDDKGLSIESSATADLPTSPVKANEITTITDKNDIAIRLGQLIEVETSDAPDDGATHLHSTSELVELDLTYTLESIGLMGEYLELLASALKEDIVGTCITFLHTTHTAIWEATLKLISHFLAHKKFAFSFLDAGGLELALQAHNSSMFPYLHRGLSMCLHGFASSTVVTEVILSRDTNRTALLPLAMALLSSPDDRARQNAVVFFGLIVPFRSALEYFEANEGLYTLFNFIRAGNTPKSAVQRQLAHDACLCLRQYVRVHFGLMAHSLRRKLEPEGNRSRKLHVWKPVDIDDKAHEQHISLFEENRPTPKDTKWQSTFSHLRGALVLLEVLEVFHNHSIDDPANEPTSYRLWLVERAQFCLQILRMLTLAYPSMALEVCSTALQDSQRTGIAILLDCAMTCHPRDGDIVKGALQVFCNCVHYPEKEKKPRDENKQLKAILKLAREKNSIKVCFQLLRYKRSLQHADSIRLLATRALLGLSRDRQMTQILEQIQIGQLLSDMVRNEPVLEENAEVHAKFREYAMELISHVTHRAPSSAIHEATDPTVRKIEKANIVAATRVTYNPNELLLMIHEHLKANGLNQAADALENEASLKLNNPCLSPQKLKKTKSFNENDIPAAKRFKVDKPKQFMSYSDKRKKMRATMFQPSYFDKDSSQMLSPKKTIVNKKPVKTTWLDTVVQQHLREQHRLCPNPVSIVPSFSLAKSKTHRCPDVSLHPLYSNVCSRILNRGIGGLGVDTNLTRFISSRHRPYRIVGHHHDEAQGGLTSGRFFMNQQMLLGTDHGELMQINMERDEVVGVWKCHPNTGALSDIVTNEQSPMAFQHGKPLILTGTTRLNAYVTPKVSLWDIDSMSEARWSLLGMRSPHFNSVGDHVVAMASQDSNETNSIHGSAIYDIETGSLLSNFYDVRRNEDGNTYGDNSNCLFSPCDSTLLTDGMLWDVRTSKLLHQFDKLSNFGYGYYNPNGNQVMINSAIWDLRTFKLLRVIPALENCKVQFCSTRPVMYAYSPFEPNIQDLFKKLPKNRSWLRIIDTRDYKDISNIDIERPIYDISLNAHETTLSIVEGRHLESVYGQDRPVCRLYEIGRDMPNECDSDIEDTLEGEESESNEDGFESNSSAEESTGSEEDSDDDMNSVDEFDTDTDYEENSEDEPFTIAWALPEHDYMDLDEIDDEED